MMMIMVRADDTSCGGGCARVRIALGNRHIWERMTAQPLERQQTRSYYAQRTQIALFLSLSFLSPCLHLTFISSQEQAQNVGPQEPRRTMGLLYSVVVGERPRSRRVEVVPQPMD
jgi:hypothetical protein